MNTWITIIHSYTHLTINVRSISHMDYRNPDTNISVLYLAMESGEILDFHGKLADTLHGHITNALRFIDNFNLVEIDWRN